MNERQREVQMTSALRYGYDFIPREYLPEGRDEYWLRNMQSGAKPWRALAKAEIDALVQNGNYCPRWEDFLVCDPFDPARIKNSEFYGLVRLGALGGTLLVHHDFQIPCGIRNSTIISCDIGDNTAIQECSCISHYIIGDFCILSRIDELQVSNHAKFGNGIIKEGEDEEVRVWIDVMNEAGGRSILPFESMIPADAYLWAAYRDDGDLTEALKQITQKSAGLSTLVNSAAGESAKRGFYGTIGSGAVVKSCRIIKDTLVGEGAYIKGANKLKNLSILSSEEDPTQIGEGVELVNGIIGCGSHVFYGAKAVRFVIGRRCNLKYGARLIHSVLGDNSTVSCCEILNNLIFPVHEQHHNNSFLIAGLIEGMSNMAAGATIGSNHNSRANDGEIRAGRGFWPGLSVTLKHSSRFASFCLIVKGDYPYELDISLPFALVNNNVRKDRLEVMPAYFWMYNLYALERNSWKTKNRDKRRIKTQHIETDYLAPDTAEEIISALGLLENWMDKQNMPYGIDPKENPAGNYAEGEEDPEYSYSDADAETLSVSGLERHKRKTAILKPRKARAAYREMLFYYGIKTLVDYALLHRLDLRSLPESLFAQKNIGRVDKWVNLGGQIVPLFRVDELRAEIKSGAAADWEAVHARYSRMAALYDSDKLSHAAAVLEYLKRTGGINTLENRESFKTALGEAVKIQYWISDQVLISRAKDFHDPFRGITYRNEEEMRAVAGKVEENSFVRLAREKAAAFEKAAALLIAKQAPNQYGSAPESVSRDRQVQS
ncbi:MAG: DUF4954 family protein [Treponema sp.]|jgi:hypothetical protein|nr:DUF4954 family protein [Treponema sp.]